MSSWQTRRTLIQRAKKQDDELAWDDFVNYYSGFIAMLLHKTCPGHSDHEDIVQATLLKIWKQLPGFDENGEAKFRTWLSHLIRNCLIDYLRKHSKHKQVHVADNDGGLPEQLMPSSEAEIESLIESEWEAHITRLALAAIAKRFSGKAMQVFEMSMKNTPIEEICQTLDLTTDSVYTLKNRVKKFLMRQIKELRNELEL